MKQKTRLGMEAVAGFFWPKGSAVLTGQARTISRHLVRDDTCNYRVETSQQETRDQGLLKREIELRRLNTAGIRNRACSTLCQSNVHFTSIKGKL